MIFTNYLPAALMGATLILPMVVTSVATALSSQEVGEIAKKITVLIQTPFASGSGIIVGRQGNTYRIITNEHVIRDVTPGAEVDVITSDQERHRVGGETIKVVPGVDLAVLELVSNKDYPVAQIGDGSAARAGSKVYVAGYPVITISITRPIYTFTEGKITANASRPLEDGYSLVYNNSTLPGMSGGAVLNEKGELIGVHGRADIDTKLQKTGNPDVRIKTGFNLGIPISIYQSWSDTGNTPDRIAANTMLRADDFFIQAGRKYEQGDDQGALANLNQAIALNPNYVYGYYNRGLVKSNLGDYPGAIADFDRALELDSKLVEAYNNRGNAKSNLGDISGAIADFDRALELDSKLVEAYNNRGNAKSSLGDLPGAIADYSAAINLNPNLASAYYNRGLARSELGEKEPAIKDYTEAIRLNGKFWQAMNNIGLIRYEMGQLEEAIAQWKGAVAVDSQLLEPRFALAVALYSQGNRDESISMAKTVLKLDQRYGNLEFLKSHLWGDRLVKDTQKLLNSILDAPLW